MEEPVVPEYLVVGGGIAGVSCVEMLALLSPASRITLLTATPMVKAITDVSQLTKLLTEFKVEEQEAGRWEEEHAGIKVIQGVLETIETKDKRVLLKDGRSISYSKLCLCTGATPKVIGESNPHVLGIRDTESVAQLQAKLNSARRVIVVGNGGIATELVYELENINVIWAVKDDSISSVFLDPGAAEFLLSHLSNEKDDTQPVKRKKYAVEEGEPSTTHFLGSALGPDWHKGFTKKGAKGRKNIHIKYGVEVDQLRSPEQFSEENVQLEKFQDLEEENGSYNLYVKFSDGSWSGADFLVSATGVIPGGEIFREFVDVSDEGGIKVDQNMQTSNPDIYAAGDVSTAGWTWSQHWFQMRLWTQARLMGMFAGKCMQSHTVGEPIDLDFSFEMFTHVTSFFGFKVILLGLYKGQTLDKNYEILLRVTKGKELVKAVMKDGRMQGAILIGETELEETFENLILNQMDLSSYGADLLDPNIDIEDYFD